MYGGAILSPVNYEQEEVTEQVTELRERAGGRSIFDPQLYVPTSDRGKLRTWSYFPNDVDTADLSAPEWWDELVAKVAETVRQVAPAAVCSPATLYRTYAPGYFADSVRVGRTLRAMLAGTDIETLQTVIVGLPDLTSRAHRMEIASIVSDSDIAEVFLVLVGNTEPRRELTDVEELKGAMSFIRTLENADIRVTVGYCSSDVLLWKSAGATNCATGKFFNLRRFTRTRFEEPTGGGGQLEYWFEQNLIAFLRQSDLVRVQQAQLLSQFSMDSPCRGPVFQKMQLGEPWVALGWRQYMHWFGCVESSFAQGQINVDDLLASAEGNWEQLKQRRVLMEEVANDGRWLRPWRRALAEYQ